MKAIAAVLKHTEILFDTLPVPRHASAARDEVRHQEFFRVAAVMRAYGRQAVAVAAAPEDKCADPTA